MAIAKITGPGLLSILLLVVCLWTCILEESRISKRANEELARNLIELRHLQRGHHTIPVAAPAHWSDTSIGI
jgi:hypothetical protein